MSHQNNNYNNYNNFNNSNNNFNNLPRDEIYASQNKSLSELNQKESKLQNDIKFGVSVIVVIAAILIIVLGILIFGRGSSGTNEVEGQEEVAVKYIGNDKVGYLSVPKDWEQHVEIGNTTLMYQDPSQTYIVAIDALEKKKDSLETIAQNSAKNLTSSGKYKEISLKKDKIGSTEAYLVSAFSIPEGKWIFNWLFMLDDDLVHFVSFETPNTDTEFAEIPNTFTMTKQEEKSAQ